MRRANGTGTVVRLSGQRRNSYVVRVPGRNKRGRVIQTALGYYPTAAKAQAALDEYNRQKAAGLAADKTQMTVRQVYELWSARKYAKAGAGLKRSQSFADNAIPLVLGVCGVVLALAYVLGTSALSGWRDVLMAAFTAVTQGILCAGASVYVNQLVKQATKSE